MVRMLVIRRSIYSTFMPETLVNVWRDRSFFMPKSEMEYDSGWLVKARWILEFYAFRVSHRDIFLMQWGKRRRYWNRFFSFNLQSVIKIVPKFHKILWSWIWREKKLSYILLFDTSLMRRWLISSCYSTACLRKTQTAITCRFIDHLPGRSISCNRNTRLAIPPIKSISYQLPDV